MENTFACNAFLFCFVFFFLLQVLESWSFPGNAIDMYVWAEGGRLQSPFLPGKGQFGKTRTSKY